ncbi:hypothetical protein PV327_010403 [Microctonus hyperodae]|uniref:Uncharacterized protein n=1 Tax=Microctonus hyperodae TaxID=165561 RepID=A0AA39FS67_MICHY|nr:hypothetical protein PV327_010403 [Microctonus hyperodae]
MIKNNLVTIYIHAHNYVSISIMHSEEYKKKIRLNISAKNESSNEIAKRIINEIIANYDEAETIKKNDVNIDEAKETEDVNQENFNLQSILYACCVYICGLLIFIAIVTSIMAIFYFPYVRDRI